MRDLPNEHFELAISTYEKRDPELTKELYGKLASKKLGLSTGRIENVKRSIALSPQREAETIVRPDARPVLVIRDNRVTKEFIGPESEIWANRVIAAQRVLDKVIPAIGRVEVNNNPDSHWLGTGWLIAEDIIVTNRHVASAMGRLGPSGFTFKMGLNGSPQSARLDFLEEYGHLKAAEFSVTAILWIATPSQPDVAFLRVARIAGGLQLAAPLALADSVSLDEMVATIGYPARDSRVPDQELVRSVFGDVYEKKRLAVGQIIAAGQDEIEHDCSTLGGNSGSPLIRLSTGEVLGLHFAGTFMHANYAVAAPKVRELLTLARRSELPGMGPTEVVAPNRALSASESTYTFRLNVPIEVTVRIGDIAFPSATPSGFSPAIGALSSGIAVSPIEAAVLAAKMALKGRPEVIEVRSGYRFKRGWITGERVVVVELRKKRSAEELRTAGIVPIPTQFEGVGVDVRTAAIADQLEHLGVSLESLEAPPRPGRYVEPPNLSLLRVNESMKAVFHISPDSGFPNLRAFLSRVDRQLTATMYEWDVNHISEAIESAIRPATRTLRLVTQRAGTKEAVADMQNRLGNKMEHVWASVGSGKLIPKAYHIKVASRDGEEFWLSSGNWKSSNQPDINPSGDGSTLMKPLREHNREWHVIVANVKLATMFQKYIEWDFREALRVPDEELPEIALPDLFVPEETFDEATERPLRAKYFAPLELDRTLDIQALLTPDQDSRGRRVFISTAVEMMRRARNSIFVENQSFNILAENVDEFEEFFSVLRDRQSEGLDVRVIFRDPREFSSSGGVKLQKMLEVIREFGLNTDQIKVQRRCHTKGIIIDDSEVLLGSHNLTNQGSLYNRDASLLIRDQEVAQYFKDIFEFDWITLAIQEADEMIADVRIAMPNKATPVGFRRVSAREALGLN
jgi:hypothetical protein